MIGGFESWIEQMSQSKVWKRAMAKNNLKIASHQRMKIWEGNIEGPTYFQQAITYQDGALLEGGGCTLNA